MLTAPRPCMPGRPAGHGLAWLVGSLLSVAPPASAAEPAPDEEAGSFVIVDRAAWLHLAPEDGAARLRAAPLDAAPEHAASPSLVLLRRGPPRNGFLPVKVISHSAPEHEQFGAAPPDQAPPEWSHCYVQPPILAQAQIDAWVRVDDLLPVLTRDVDLTLEDGTRVQLAKGLSVTGSRGRLRVRGIHMDIVLDTLPRGATATAYNRTEPPAQRLLIAEQAGTGSWMVQPTWSVLLDARGDQVLPKRNTADRGEAVDVLRDRCIRVAFPAAVGPVPRVDESALRGPVTYPIWAERGAAIRLERGTPLGRTGDNLVLWTRRDCDWSEDKGLCCKPLAGIELQGTDEAVCFETAMPEQGAARDLAKVLADRARRMTYKLQTASGLDARVKVGAITVRGTMTESDVRAVLNSETKAFAYCYDRRLGHDPTLAGQVQLRFAVAPDAHARNVVVVRDQLNAPTVTTCIAQRLEIPAFVPQLGQPASMVEVDLQFSTGAARKAE